MTSVTAAPGTRRPTAPSPGGNALAGTRTLIRFALRRDRVRLPVWVLALTLATLMTADSLGTLYSDPEDRSNAVASVDSPAGLAMSGPRHYLVDDGLGSILAHQMLGFTAVLVGLMSVLIVTRHTRAEEETGRAELVRSAVVGRHAHLAAALSVAALANLVLALLLAVGLTGLGLEGVDAGGSLVYGVAHAGAGLVFAGVAAVTVQVTAQTRGASGFALAAIGVAYVLRAPRATAGAATSCPGCPRSAGRSAATRTSTTAGGRLRCAWSARRRARRPGSRCPPGGTWGRVCARRSWAAPAPRPR